MRCSIFFALILTPLFIGGAAPAAGEAKSWEALTYHKAPAPLAADARTEDWPRFLGPQNTPVSGETRIRQDFAETGPALVWECAKGSGYACPVIADGCWCCFTG